MGSSAFAAGPDAPERRIVQQNSSRPEAAADDCASRIQKLDDSTAEGEERLAAKNDVIEFCGRQYRRDKTINGLVQQCAKFEGQPVVQQQFVAECQLAAFRYANALLLLKTESRK